MKKQYIILILIVVAGLTIGCISIFKDRNSKQNDSFNYQNQNIEQGVVSSLSLGNWVSVVAEKTNGSFSASMIMVCKDKDNCQANSPNRDNLETPNGDAPMKTPPTDSQNKRTGSLEGKTMLSGTISEINSDSLVLSLDTGEAAIVLISDLTRINKR